MSREQIREPGKIAFGGDQLAAVFDHQCREISTTDQSLRVNEELTSGNCTESAPCKVLDVVGFDERRDVLNIQRGKLAALANVINSKWSRRCGTGAWSNTRTARSISPLMLVLDAARRLQAFADGFDKPARDCSVCRGMGSKFG